MSWKIRNEEQFEAWWEQHGRTHPSPSDAARSAWDEAHKQRDEDSNLIIGKGFWGKAVANTLKDKKLIEMHVEVLNRQMTNLQIYMQGQLGTGGGVLQRIMDGEHESFIEIATGDRLDSMGKHVGVTRDGMPDADYRNVIRYELRKRGRIK